MAKSNNKVEYIEIARAKVTKSRNIVISNCSEGGFTIVLKVDSQLLSSLKLWRMERSFLYF